ncbi:hypothetical protein SDC9_171120 [bioreactor metagenome]|uniref:4Fe-4S ferredoxin-type domain-containing protein n=1 Tax=bioreactor metagenome TaxID=1076179 RepID=A0A645G9Z3_9ZZZZ
MVSVDAPLKYMTYYLVLLLFFVLSVVLGKRGACHTICWMAPFLTGGYWLGRLLRLHQLRISSDAAQCIGCSACDKACPMSIPVSKQAKAGAINSSDCILCCECADACPVKVLKLRFIGTGPAVKDEKNRT